MSLLPSLLATVVSGVLYALAFPPLRWRALSWIALVPLLLALRDASWRRRAALGVVWTLVSGWSVGTWMATAVATYFDQSLAAGLAIFLIVTLGMAAPYYTAFAIAYGPLAQSGAATPLVTGAAWAAAELARGRLLNGTLGYVGNSPWATLGYSQTGVLPLVQVASITGVYGVSFVVAMVNGALAELLSARSRGTVAARRARIGAASAVGVLAVVLVGGWLALARPPDAAAPHTEIALVQGDVGAAVRWSAEGPSRTLETYGKLTREILASATPAVVFWPEAALTSFVEQDDVQRRALASLLPGDTELVFGAPRAGGPAGAAPFANSIYQLRSDGTFVARYDKEFLLPFMEYFPLRVDFVRRHFGRVREFAPGAPTAPLPTHAGAAGLLVCNEAFLPHVAGARVAAGATYLVSPSNDSWVPNAGFAWQQFDIAAMRAVEQRRFLVRVSDSGPSGVVDPFGRVLAHTAPLERATLAASVTPLAARSIYGTVGDAFGAACALLVGTALVRSASRR